MVNQADLLLIVTLVHRPGTSNPAAVKRADMNGDGVLNYQDEALVSQWIRQRGVPGPSGLRGQSHGPEVFYIHFDQVGTPRLLVDASGETRWRWDQTDPFGIQLPIQSPQTDSIALPFNLRFPGQYYDRETGLHHNGYRDYDPVTGRYIESDPIGLAGGVNTYLYVTANPVSDIDPAGLCGVFTPLCYYLVTYGAEIAVGTEIIATIATNTPSPVSNSVSFTGRAAQQLTHEVYLGMRSTKPVYVGITSAIANRACQHGDRFDAMVKLTNGSPITRDQARALEQAILELNPHFENQINSIASTRTWYQEAVQWGKQWLNNYGM